MIRIVVAAIAAVFAGAIAYQEIGAARDRRRYPARGRLVEVNGRRLHVVEQGAGRPAVVFEAGLAASSLSWSRVQPRVAEFAQTVSYDRAGLGWSEACGRYALEPMTHELHALLDKAAIAPPYVLVGHSFGALIVGAFAHFYPHDAAGVVLVDPVSIASWANCSEEDRRRIALGARLSRRGAWLARLGVVRLAVATATLVSGRLTKAIARASAGRATSLLGRLVGEIQKLPAELVPAVRAHWSAPKSFRAMAGYLECLPEAARLASQLTLPPQIPVVILSAASATAEEIAERERWIAGRAKAEQWRVPETGHWLHLERPEVVVQAVRRVLRGI